MFSRLDWINNDHRDHAWEGNKKESFFLRIIFCRIVLERAELLVRRRGILDIRDVLRNGQDVRRGRIYYFRVRAFVLHGPSGSKGIVRPLHPPRGYASRAWKYRYNHYRNGRW